MRRFVPWLFSLLVALPAFAAESVIAFVNVNVVPMTSNVVLPNQTVIVRDGRIASISSARRVPKNAKVIEGRGRYLMPGLVDAHAHLPGHDGTEFDRDRYFALMLSRGVTTLRVMRGDAEQLEWKRQIEHGDFIAPHLLVSSPPIWSEGTMSEEEVRKLVRDAAAQHYDLVKFLGGLDRPRYDAMLDEAKKQRITVGGHVPKEIGLAYALERGQSDVEHVSPIVTAAHAEGVDIDALISRMARQRTYHTANAYWYGVHFGTRAVEELDRSAGLGEVPAVIRQQWHTDVEKANADVATRDHWRDELALYATLLKKMNDAGVPLLVSPSDGEYVVPGYGMLEEMRFFKQAGISPYDTLRAATRNAAESVHGNFGVVRKGARADLLLLSRNPLDDIENVGSVEGVMVGGGWLVVGGW
jgi:imidazolonepropionase-like amidohydrolase